MPCKFHTVYASYDTRESSRGQKEEKENLVNTSDLSGKTKFDYAIFVFGVDDETKQLFVQISFFRSVNSPKNA